ncbi:MAG: PH domain-containing protein [Pirellula sp.]|jgi:membrane protein YdbS with pleckstrin-like domain
MSDHKSKKRVSEWCYLGIWGIFTRFFLVPDQPPNLPVFGKEHVEYHRPAPSFLAYKKFQFWIALLVLDGIFLGLWIALSIALPLWGLITAPLWLALIVLPDIIAYVALHLAYDTTWYVLSDRSMRIRRGIWTIHETTITFENVQNVNIVQGPLQRWFGFANLSVSTAGGGNSTETGGMNAHSGWLEGITNAEELRQRILEKAQHNAGLGDEPDARHSEPQPHGSFSREQIALLQDIHSLTEQWKRIATGSI